MQRDWSRCGGVSRARRARGLGPFQSGSLMEHQIIVGGLTHVIDGLVDDVGFAVAANGCLVGLEALGYVVAIESAVCEALAEVFA